MHLIQDENGNPVPHSHEHSHSHTHTYEHSHPHTHEDGNEGDHNHTHEHGAEACPANEQACEHTHCDTCEAHSHEEPQGDKMAALLDYMLKHNEHHASELDQVAEKLRADGKTAAADQIKKAVDEFQKGNLYLKLALSMVQDD